jgi:hypothetical protein
MNKTSVIMSVTTLAIALSSTAMALGSNNYVGAQVGMTSTSGDNSSTDNNFNLYGFMFGTSIRDNINVDLNVVNQGTYYHAMVDAYFNHALSSNVTSRIGAGAGGIHINENGGVDATTKFAWQAAVEMEYSVNPTLGFFSGYHYVAWSNEGDTHANEYMIGMHYYI